MGNQGKTTLHYVEVVEASESNETIPLRVVTRAQAQQQEEQQPEKEGIKRKPRRRTQRKASS